MSEPGQDHIRLDLFVGGAYQRIVKITGAISIVAVVTLLIFFSWRVALGAGLGCAIAYLNFIWLHHGADVLVSQMLAAGRASRVRLFVTFAGRYLFVMAIGYAIFKSSLQVLYGFMGALFIPVAAVMCEAVYEALASSNRKTQN